MSEISLSCSNRRLLINDIRRTCIVDEFTGQKGNKVFILLSQFPFLVIGKIVDVVGDFVFIDVETTHVTEIEGKVLRVHADAIEVFYIEGLYDGPPIPVIGRENMYQQSEG